MAATLCRVLYQAYVEFSTMKRSEPRLTPQTIKVLSVLMSSPQEEISGVEVAERTGLASGTLYPILIRLEEAGWLQSRWEVNDPAALGRPRRRLYRVTSQGAKNLQAVVRDLTPAYRRLVWR
jgi:PadR family transcriptional regulator PadR